MQFFRDNLIGILLLLVAIVSAAIMIQAIYRGERASIAIPDWAGGPIVILGLAAAGWLIWQQFRQRRR